MFSRLCLVMLLAAVAVGSLSVSAAPPKWRDLSPSYSFAQYLRDFPAKARQYAQDGPEEYKRRERVFTANLQRILQHNADPDASYRMGINQFTDVTEEEHRRTYRGIDRALWRKGKKDTKPRKLTEEDRARLAALPDSVDWRDAGVVSAVKDQGHCGSCWAFATTETVESYVAIETGELWGLSPQQITSCAPNPFKCGGTGGCAGATVEIGLDYIAQAGGLAQEWTYSYTSYNGASGTCDNGSTPAVTVTGFEQLEVNDYVDLMENLANTGPIAVSVDASWGSYEEGVFTAPEGTCTDIDHAVQAVGYGYDEDSGLYYWTIRNSWSPSWGENGYIRLEREDPNTVDDTLQCGEDTTPQDGTACEWQTDPITVCGTCGVLSDSTYATGATTLQ